MSIENPFMKTSRRGVKFFTEKEQRRMFDMFKQGATTAAIAETMPDRSLSTVKRKLDRMGLTLNSRF